MFSIGLLVVATVGASLQEPDLGIRGRLSLADEVRHRVEMPKARQSWFTDARNPGSLFTYQGPNSLSGPSHGERVSTLKSSGPKEDVAYDPSNPNVIYSASEGGLWKTTNGGTDWTCINEGWDFARVTAIAVHPVMTSRILAAGIDGIHRSTNGGSSWTHSDGVNGIVTRIHYVREDPDIVLVVADSLYRSTDGGQTFTDLGLGREWKWVAGSKVAFAGQNRYLWLLGTSSLKKSTDLGATWSDVVMPASWNFTPQPRIATSTIDPDRVAIMAGYNLDLLFRTNNGGNSWTNITPDDAGGVFSYSEGAMVEYLPNGTTETLVSAGRGIHVSEDNGLTWYVVSDGDRMHEHGTCVAPHPVFPNAAVIGTVGGLYTMTYSDVTHSGAFASLNANLPDHYMGRISVHPTSWSNIMGATAFSGTVGSRGNLSNWKNLSPSTPSVFTTNDVGGNGFDQANNGRHYVTDCAGNVWRYDSSTDTTPTNIGGPQPGINAPLAMVGAGYQTVATGSLDVSTNFAGTSGWITGSPTYHYVRGLSSSRRNPDRVYIALQHMGVNYSINRGATNAPRSSPAWTFDGDINDVEESPFTDYRVLAAARVYASALDQTQSGIWRCAAVNSASPAWEQRNGISGTATSIVGGMNCVIFDPIDSQTYYAGSDAGLFMTKDGGANWYDMSGLGLPKVGVADLVVSQDNKYLYVSTKGRGIWRLSLKTINVTSLTASLAAVYGGQSFDMTATINVPASPATRITLTSTNSAVIPPTLVTFNVGSTTKTFSVRTTSPASTINASVTATLGTTTATDSITVHPKAVISSMSINPSPCYTGQVAVATVHFQNPLPIPTTVYLTETSSRLNLPGNTSTFAPAGATSASFNVPVAPNITSDTTASVHATVHGDPTTTTATVVIHRLPKCLSISVPAFVQSPLSFIGTVTLDRPAQPGGCRVEFNDPGTYANLPTSIVVSAGASSATFTGTTTRPPTDVTYTAKAWDTVFRTQVADSFVVRS